MNNKIIMTVAMAALVGFGAANVTAGPIDYSSTTGSKINFNGSGGFSFSPALDSFVIDDGTAAGLLGDMGGTYSIGIVSPDGSGFSAPVTGSGSFVIHDGATPLTGTLSWVDIFQRGTGGDLNTLGVINLTGVSYAGSNPDLLALLSSGDIDTLTFQFVPAVSLAALKGPSTHSTSFSGTIATVPDGGTTVGLLGLALGVCGVFARKFKHA
jgi:VPDSG-CTERM motif